MAARMVYVYTLSPLHCGTGQSSEVIDLPVARERVTNWPVIPGSSIKGPLKEALRPSGGNGAAWRSAFGPDTAEAAEGASGLAFGDARLLCFPVRSYAGTFAWLTCPLALRRWQRDHEAAELELTLPELGAVPAGGILVAEGSRLPVTSQQVVLEDLDLTPQVSPAATAVARALAAIVFREAAWQAALPPQFGIAADDVFTFLTETATEVAARVRINSEQKTVEPGALWYEEAVPAEAIFAGPVLGAPRGGHAADTLLGVLPARQVLQLGGHAGVGRGLVEITVAGGLA